MNLSRHGLLAFWLALQLLLAQQFALAHHVDHSAETLVAHASAAVKHKPARQVVQTWASTCAALSLSPPASTVLASALAWAMRVSAT